jgi:protocatechuate 4,5-dioxygenase alpha chain
MSGVPVTAPTSSTAKRQPHRPTTSRPGGHVVVDLAAQVPVRRDARGGQVRVAQDGGSERRGHQHAWPRRGEGTATSREAGDLDDDLIDGGSAARYSAGFGKGSRRMTSQPGGARRRAIAGTTLFDGAQARKGYALNKMCFSFNEAANREAFLRDEDAYCRAYGLDEAQRKAIADRNVLDLIAAGGNVYYLAKFAGIFGLDVQDIGAQQTGMSKEAFKARLVAAGR